MKVKSAVLHVLQVSTSSYVPTEMMQHLFGRSYTAAISRLKKEGYKIVILKYTNDKRATRGYYLEKPTIAKRQEYINNKIAVIAVAVCVSLLIYFLTEVYVR